MVSVWGLQFASLFWKQSAVASSGLIRFPPHSPTASFFLVTTAAVVECSNHHDQFCHRPFAFPVYTWIQTTTLSGPTFRSSFHLLMSTYLGESSRHPPLLHQPQQCVPQLSLRSSTRLPYERCVSLCVTFLFVFSHRNYNRVLWPQSMCIHPTFHVSKVKPFHENPGSWLLRRPAWFSLHHRGRAFQYLLDWNSYEWEGRSWVPARHIFDPALNAKFEQGHPDQSVEVKSERLDVPHAQSSSTIFQIGCYFLALPATLPASLAPALVYYLITSVPTSFACILPGSCLLNDLSPGLFFFPLDAEVGITVPLLALDFMLLSIFAFSCGPADCAIDFYQVPVLFVCCNWLRFRLVIVITVY